MIFNHKQPGLRERAAMFSSLIREPGWELLQRSFRSEIRTRITDTDGKEAFLYEAIRAQVIQEIFATPLWVIHQAEREWSRSPANSPKTSHPASDYGGSENDLEKMDEGLNEDMSCQS